MTRYATSPLPSELAASHPRDGQGATAKQLDYLASLASERAVKDEARELLTARLRVQRDEIAKRGDRAWADNGISLRVASQAIETIKQLPKQPRTPAAETWSSRVPNTAAAGAREPIITPDDVPAGHYAIKNADGELRFYHVWWAPAEPGRRPFFKLYVEHGPDDSEVRPFGAALGILREIAKEPADAARRYGRHIGACSRCGRRLTNRISRLLDIGPVCGGHFYDDEIWASFRARAREALRAAGLDPDADVEDTDDLDTIRERIAL